MADSPAVQVCAWGGGLRTRENIEQKNHCVGFMLPHRHLMWLIIREKGPAIHCDVVTPLCLTFVLFHTPILTHSTPPYPKQEILDDAP